MLLFVAVLLGTLNYFSESTRAEWPRPRVQNTTLRLPDRIPVQGYGLINAFPALTFAQPVALASPPGDTNRLFIVERTGTVYVITNLANPTKTLFLDLSQQVESASPEAGLLGLAFHPGFATNRWFFIFATLYASTPGAPNRFHDVLLRFEASPGNSNLVLTNSKVTLLAQVDDSSEHNGGDLKFGPDGYLYICIGERVKRNPDWPDQTPIDRDLHGAILRIDVDGHPGNLPPNPHPASTTNYWIPADNPFVGATQHHGLAVSPAQVRTELFATGFRNPYRMAFHPVTGDLYAADVGEARQEEINLVIKGEDYGWPYFEGMLVNEYLPPPVFTPRAPVHVYSHGWSGGTNGDCIIGGVVYQGTAIPSLQGRYLFADFRSGYLWSLWRNGPGPVVERLLDATIGLSAFGVDPRDTEILVTHLYDGTILRLIYVPPETSNAPATLADTGIFADLATLTPNSGIEPYELNVPFWSDHADKKRWFSLPQTNLNISIDATGAWTFPTGAVWIKHFELQLTNGQAASARRLETRVLVNSSDGFYGLTYRWGDSATNAWLVPPEGQEEEFVIRDPGGGIVRKQRWRYPSRAECMNCHTRWGGRVLGFSIPQFNRLVSTGTGKTNQLTALSSAGYVNPPFIATVDLPALAPLDDADAPLEFRVRSHLQANCSMCHVPEAHAVASFDARLATPLHEAGIVSPRGIVTPGSLQDSRLYHRLVGWERLMPPIATSVHNSNAINLVASWITNLPPAPWTYKTIGDTIHTGGSILSNGIYHVGGTGLTLQGTNDAFLFLHQPFNQSSAHFVVRLVSQRGVGEEAFAGLMVRDDLTASARFLMAATRRDGFAASLSRNATGVAAATTLSGPVVLPQWFRLVRSPEGISAFRSDDGTNWIGVASNWPVSDSAYVGFAVNSGSGTVFNNAVFDQVSSLAITLTSPASNVLEQPANVPLHANVYHSGRALARVEFYDGDTKIGEVPSAPYSLVVTNVLYGQRKFRALAVDEAGTSVSSAWLSFSVRPAATLAVMGFEDRTNRGSWPRSYGINGYLIVNHQTNFPSFIEASTTNAVPQTWAFDTQDQRALARVGTTGRIAAALTASNSFLVSLKIRDGEFYRLSLYFLDWDTSHQRIQLVELIDPATGAVLTSRTIFNFSLGLYLVFTVRGDIDIRITRASQSGPGPVLSGLFLDKQFDTPHVAVVKPIPGQTISLPSDLVLQADVSAGDSVERVDFYMDEKLIGVAHNPYTFVLTNLLEGPHTVFARAFNGLGAYADSASVPFHAALPRAKAVFLREDTQTHGNWLQRYGTEGFLIPPLTNWWPMPISWNMFDASTWLQFGDDTNYLQLPDETARALPYVYSFSNLVYDLKLTDGHNKSVALYFYDEAVNSQVVTVLDAGTGQILDSRRVTNGFGGRYLVWNLQGHLQFRIANVAPHSEARLMGLFVDPFTNAAPEVSLLQPEGILSLNSPAKVLLAAGATSIDGVRTVEFRTPGAKLGEVRDPPYEFLWEFPITGSYEVFARAVSTSGAVNDSPQKALVHVAMTNSSRARFVRIDEATGGDWNVGYGTEGYWIPSISLLSNIPPTVSLSSTQQWVDYGHHDLPRTLRHPGTAGRIFSHWIGESVSFRAGLIDGRAHLLSIYNYSYVWTNPVVITIRAPASQSILDRREISDQTIGLYVTWEIQGEVEVELTAESQRQAFLNGIFFDLVTDPYDDWRRLRFAAAQQLDPEISGPAADPDADDYNNWSEYLLGRDPRRPNEQSPLWLSRGTNGTFLHVLLAKTGRPAGISVQSAPNLHAWTEASGLELLEIHDEGDRTQHIYRLLQVPGGFGPARFFRLQLPNPPGD